MPWRGVVFASTLRLLALLAAAGLTLPAWATNRALLVGVSQYPDLPAALQLKAPANDVRLMRQVLKQRGFDDANIEILADAVDGARLPTQGAILTALQGLAGRSRPGDTVYLHFSGHGSLQPAAAVTTAPASGWQPIFLPRDVRGWDGKAGVAVPNAIADTVLRDAVDRINATGALVFAVFDACHSARLVRGALPGTDASLVRVRQVSPQALGVVAPAPPDVWPLWVTQPRDAAPSRGRGRAVYFYAAQSYELAASLPMPAGLRDRWHGLFSWHVAQALALGQPMSYRQLGQHLLSRYDQLQAATATPLYSGDGLDEPVFGQEAPIVRQWPLERRQGRLLLPAGALSGLAEGALLALLSDPIAPGAGPALAPKGTLGFARLATLEANQAWLDAVPWLGYAAPSVAQLPAGSWARLVSNPPSFALRVSSESAGCRAECPAGRALAQLQREGIPGVDARWVAGYEQADVRLRATDRGVRLLLPGAAEGDRSTWGHAAETTDDTAHVEVLAQQTAAALHRVARTRNLLQLAARLALRNPASGLEVALKIRRRTSALETTLSSDRLVELGPGDLLLLDGHNAGADPLDMVAFWLGFDQSIRRIYPEDARDAPRLAAGDRLRRAGWSVDERSEGMERLLILSVPMRRGQEAADFRFLEQSPLSRLRGAVDADLQALFDACFADHRTRGDASPALPPERLGMQVYTFRITP
jgi:hypothetical protein